MENRVEDTSNALATYVATLSSETIPSDALTVAERSIVDTVGVMLAGLEEESTRLTTELVKLRGGDGPNQIFSSPYSASPMDAALVHGTAAHSLDFDDTSAAINGHPSATMIPALLSVAEGGRVSGRDVLTAYVAGFETQSYIAAPILESHYRTGWHTTATLGTFGAAASTAKLLNLKASEIENSLNIAASMSSGLKRNFGSMTKPFHAGHAARCGLTATMLAKEGFTAGSSTISGDGGFLDLHSDSSTIELGATHPVDGRWFITERGIHVKKYPCCHYTHAAIEETIQLVGNHGIGPDDIEQIHVTGSPGAVDAADVERPETSVEGKFSMPFLLASAAVFRDVRLDTFGEETMSDPRVLALMERVTFEEIESRSYGSLSSDIRIETKDGDKFSVEDARAPGLYGINPISEVELRDKFLMCARTELDDATAEDLWSLLANFRTVKDVSEASELLA